MKRKVYLLLLICFAFGMLCGCADEEKTDTFSKHTDVKVFKNVPIMQVENATIGEAVDYGDGNYVITIDGTVKADYDAYLKKLEDNKFEKYVSNDEGFDSSVYSATYTKGKVVVTITHIERINKTYISAGDGNPLSEHLLYDEKYLDGNNEGAKTSLHVVEMYYFGSSFIIQLKNGHFILNDGGTDYDTPYLFDYLESLVPEGEKPIIDALIISHAHYDHLGWIITYATENDKYKDRIYVNGIYFTEPSEEVIEAEGNGKNFQYLDMAASKMQTIDGNTPQIYRMHTGQRYYFNDIVMDVVLSQEQILVKDYKDGFNESSTWLLYHIEGQKVMIGGDSGPAGMKKMMEMYSSDYMKFDMYSALHHGYNVRDDFVEYCTIDTVLFTERHVVSSGSNYKLTSKAKESYSYGEGTVILTFPYEVGEAKTLPNNTWEYHKGQTRPKL